MKNLDLQKLIFENYLYIVSGLVLGVVIVGSYKYYNFTIEEKSAQAGDLYEILSNTSDDEEIYNISEKIIEEYNDTVYSVFTRLYLAKYYLGKNDFQKAQSHLSFIIDNDFNKKRFYSDKKWMWATDTGEKYSGWSNLLIDDRPTNLEEFKQHGGLTIRYQANESKLDNLENKLIHLFGKI